MKKKIKIEEMKLDNSLVDTETKNTVNYYLWCEDVNFFGSNPTTEGHLIWTKEFIDNARKRAMAVKSADIEMGYSRATKKKYVREISRQLKPEEVIKAVNIEYKGDYALLQFRIIHNELKTSGNKLADLFLPEIEKYKWIGVFYGEREYEAFKFLLEAFNDKYTKKRFGVIWKDFKDSLISCKGDRWDSFIYDYYLPYEKNKNSIVHASRNISTYDDDRKRLQLKKREFVWDKDAFKPLHLKT
jgi:hypothetical protein